MQNLKWCNPSSIILFFLSTSILGKFQFCNCENAVHNGDPMSNNPLLASTRSTAFLHFSGLLKSHGLPSSGSFVVRSSDRPGTIPNLAAIPLTLVGEYISITGDPIPSSARAACILFTSSFHVFDFRCRSILPLNPWSFAFTDSSGVNARIPPSAGLS